jgi:hypothetical protein
MTINAFKDKLVQKISAAATDEEVSRYIYTAMRCLKKQSVNAHLIARFVDKALLKLQQGDSQAIEHQNANRVNHAISEFVKIKNNIHNYEKVAHVSPQNIRRTKEL